MTIMFDAYSNRTMSNIDGHATSHCWAEKHAIFCQNPLRSVADLAAYRIFKLGYWALCLCISLITNDHDHFHDLSSCPVLIGGSEISWVVAAIEKDALGIKGGGSK